MAATFAPIPTACSSPDVAAFCPHARRDPTGPKASGLMFARGEPKGPAGRQLQAPCYVSFRVGGWARRLGRLARLSQADTETVSCAGSGNGRVLRPKTILVAA